jgi:hypothetical protein
MACGPYLRSTRKARELVQLGCRSTVGKIGSGDRSATHSVMERATEQASGLIQRQDDSTTASLVAFRSRPRCCKRLWPKLADNERDASKNRSLDDSMMDSSLGCTSGCKWRPFLTDPSCGLLGLIGREDKKGRSLKSCVFVPLFSSL